MGYLTEATVDCKHGIVVGVDVFPANEKESLLLLRHLERQQKQLGLSLEKVALDKGYDTGSVHRDLELLGIQVIFLPSGFPMPQVNIDFHIIRNRIHLFAQWESLLYITVSEL